MKKIDWDKFKSNIRIGTVGFVIVFIFGLYKLSAVNGLSIFSEQNLKTMAIGTLIMIVLVPILTFISNLFEKRKKNK